MKETSQNIVVSKLEELIKKKRGNINASEAALATGYSIDEINTGFSRLLELYDSKVAMDTNTGAVVYNFTYPLMQRGKKTFKEHLHQAADLFYRGFKKVYKISIGVILIVYTVLFAGILLALMLASSSNRDSDSKGFNFDIVINIFLAIIRGMQVAAIASDMMEYSNDPSGMRYRKMKGDSKDKKSFIASVYDFVFGPERVKFDPLSDAREVIAFMKSTSGGKLTAGSILLLAGGNYETAENKLAEYTGRFQGDLSISNNGSLVAEFHNLQNVEKSWIDGKIVYYFDEVEAPYVMSGNSTGKNIGIIAMNFFNLIMSIFLIGAFIEEPMLAFTLGLFPLVFSVLFFLIPLLRIPYNAKKNRERETNILRKKLFRGLMKLVKSSMTKEKLFEAASIKPDEKAKAEKILEDMLVDYQGEISISENGEPLYSFSRLSNELKISGY